MPDPARRFVSNVVLRESVSVIDEVAPEHQPEAYALADGVLDAEAAGDAVAHQHRLQVLTALAARNAG